MILRSSDSRSSGLALRGALLTAALYLSTCGQPPTIEEIEAQVEAVGEPDFDAARKTEPGYMERYKREQHVLYQRKAELLMQVREHHRDHPRFAELMSRRWVLLGWNQEPAAVAEEVLADIDRMLEVEDHPEVVRHATYWRAFYRVHLAAPDARAMLEPALRFVERYPDDERGQTLLFLVADADEAPVDVRRRVWERMAETYPEGHWGTFAAGQLRRLEAVGEPFELSFEAVRSGERISVEQLDGQVVVVDFWSTSCLPCIEELPRLKELYAAYRPRGVEFLGVSLDEPGSHDTVLRFLDEHQIRWPIYYQGNGYESQFSRSWGVGSIPEMFVVDRQGRLVSTEARERLEGLLAELTQSDDA